MGRVEVRVQEALEFLQKGKVTFAKAAEMAGVSLWEFADLVKHSNIEWVKYKLEEVEKEIQKASRCG